VERRTSRRCELETAVTDNINGANDAPSLVESQAVSPEGETNPVPDFLAHAHAHEWSTFYESFDNLVQDNISRSNELLRRAMDLPVIADREVAQVRTEFEARLATERETHS
jgi:hypothetical protein